MNEPILEIPSEQLPAIIEIFNNSNTDARNLLINLFGSQFLPLNIKERVYDFPSACEVLGINPNFISSIVLTGSLEQDATIAAIKLQIIIKALNENWIIDLSNKDQRKYFAVMNVDDNTFDYVPNYTTTTAMIPWTLMLVSEDLTRHLIATCRPLLDQYYYAAPEL